MQDFLSSSGTENGRGGPDIPPQDRKFDLRVLLPTRAVCTVSIRDNARTDEVFEVRMECVVIGLRV